MKTKLITFLTIFTFAMGNLFAQSSDDDFEDSPKKSYRDYNHLSLGIKGGLNFLRSSDKSWQPEFGGFLEYTINPLWGLGLNYTYAMGNHEAVQSKPAFNSSIQDVNLFLSVNVSNIIAKHRSSGWQKWNLYGIGGGGVSFYDWEIKGTATPKSDVGMVALLSLLWEWNPADYIAIGLDGTYRMHNPTAYVGNWENGDLFLFSTNLSLRIKFGGKTNIRNTKLVDYEPAPKLPFNKKQYDQDMETLRNELNKRTVQLARENEANETAIRELQNQVAQLRDLAKQRPKEITKYVPTKEESEIIKTAFAQLEFESGKDVIKPASYSSLDGLAGLLQQHPEWSVELKGYTDNRGNAASNLKLSQNRANAVKNYLVRRGVSETNIKATGYGDSDPVASNATESGRAQNRRVEIELFATK